MRRPAENPLFSTILLSATAGLAAAGCQPAEEPANETNAAAEPVVDRPAVPRPQPPLGRAELLRAVARAASATAAGTPLPDDLRALDGREFEVRIRFGCRGPSTDLPAQWLGWSFEPGDRTLRVRARPTIAKDDPLVSSLGSDRFESVEGFWIPRPWLLEAVCPAAAAVHGSRGDAETATSTASAADSPGDEAAAASEEPASAGAGAGAGEPMPQWPRVGIAQFFTRADPRTRQRQSRPYSSVKTLPEGEPIGSQGFNLVLSGRLHALPGRAVIQCASKSADTPPECIVSAEFDKVWMERPETREIVAQWGGG